MSGRQEDPVYTEALALLERTPPDIVADYLPTMREFAGRSRQRKPARIPDGWAVHWPAEPGGLTTPHRPAQRAAPRGL